MRMKTSSIGISLIKSYEKCKLIPYLCPAGVPTIGWGNTIYENGVKVTLKDKPITQKRADELFLFVLKMFEKEVNSLLKTEVNQNQFDALMSFAYNVGSDIDQDNIPEGLGDSTLLRKVNEYPDDPTIEKEFLKWNKCRGLRLEGLIRRRKEEAELYFSNIKR